MNWEKLKTFLIVLFSAINIFLIVTMITNTKKSTTIPRTTIQDAVSILYENGITVNESIIPDKVINMEDITVKPITRSDDFSGLITKTEGIRFFIESNESVSTNQEMKRLLSKNKFRGYKILKNFLNGSGSVIQLIKKYPLFDACIDIKSSNGKTYIDGIWFQLQSHPKKGSDNSNVVIVPSILIDFINNEDRIKDKQTITSIDYGYHIWGNDSSSVLYTAVPCWKIALDNGQEFFYNARSGEYLK